MDLKLPPYSSMCCKMPRCNRLICSTSPFCGKMIAIWDWLFIILLPRNFTTSRSLCNERPLYKQRLSKANAWDEEFCGTSPVGSGVGGDRGKVVPCLPPCIMCQVAQAPMSHTPQVGPWVSVWTTCKKQPYVWVLQRLMCAVTRITWRRDLG